MRGSLGRGEAIVPILVGIYELDTRAVSHRLEFVEPRLITDEVMMMMVVHAPHHFRRLHPHALGFGAFPFASAAGMHRAGIAAGIAGMLPTMGAHGGVARAGRCAAST